MNIWQCVSSNRVQTLGGRWGIYSRFQYNSESFDLWASDYRGGVVWGNAFGDSAFETFLYHESSHLGDEIEARGERQRQDAQVNGLRLLASRHLCDKLRLYGGGTSLLQADPKTLESYGFQLGTELTHLPPDARGFIAVDTEWWAWRSWRRTHSS